MAHFDRYGRIAEIGDNSLNRLIPAENRGIDDHELRPLKLNKRTPETQISAVRCTADVAWGIDSDDLATDADQFRVRPQIRLSGRSRHKVAVR